MKIANHRIPEDGVYIIAEMSANHGQSFELACKTIEGIARTGANAVKLQTYTPDTITLNVDLPDFQTDSKGPWAGRTLYSLYEEAYTPWEWHADLMKIAHNFGLDLFSSPFDLSAVDFLEKLNVPAYKIASFEITDTNLIEYAAKTGKPIIISTGVATEEDIQLAIETCHKAGNRKVILLKCTSSYPAPINKSNLRMIPDYESRYNVFAGLSDHTLGITVPVVATALGAKVIEKHFILDRSLGGPDASFSLDEFEFTQMVKAVREAEQALGRIDYSMDESKKRSRDHARSLYVAKDIKLGEVITTEHVRSVRPGYGLHPKFLANIIGKKAQRSAKIGDRIDLGLFG